MLTLLFIILMIGTLGKLIGFALKMSWGLFKILLYIVCMPIMLVVMVFAGLIYIALPLLAIIGLISLLTTKTRIDPID